MKKQKRKLTKEYDKKDLHSFESNAVQAREISEKIKKLEDFIYQFELAVQKRVSLQVDAILDTIHTSKEISKEIIAKTAENLKEAEKTIEQLEADISELEKGEVAKEVIIS